MNCPVCGTDVAGDKKFCRRCGASLGELTTEMPAVHPPGQPGHRPPPGPTSAFAQPTIPPGTPASHPKPTPPPPATPPRSPAAPRPVGKPRNVPLIILIVLLAVLVVGGAVTGIVVWTVTSGGKPLAEVKSVKLERAGGGEVDPDKVPLDSELALEVRFIAKYKEGGEADLEARVIDDRGKEIASKTWGVESGAETQEKSLTFSMATGTSRPLEGRATLEVQSAGRVSKATGSVSFRAVAGKGKKLKLKEAKERATAKLQEATAAVSSIAELGIGASDLTGVLAEATGKLEEAGTEDEANEVYATAESVIGECNARRAAYEEEKKRQEKERMRQADIEACQSTMLDYAASRVELMQMSLSNFTMNDEGTHAESTVVGIATAHSDPERAGEWVSYAIIADKQGGQWVVAYFGSPGEEP